jgi:hypothetical protein
VKVNIAYKEVSGEAKGGWISQGYSRRKICAAIVGLFFVPITGYERNRNPNAAGDNYQSANYHKNNDK